jgi:hypothetical protein
MLPPRRFSPPLGPGKKSSRDRVLAQWRRVDLSGLEKARTIRTKRAADALPAVFKELRIDSRRGEAEIVKVWNSLIDPLITKHAQPTGINKGTLFVSVDSSVWLSEIVRYRRKEILERLQHSFGKEFVTKISFRLA